MFFSPSGVKLIESFIHKWNWEYIIKVGFGETTKNAIISHFGKCEFTPVKPDLEALRMLLNEIASVWLLIKCSSIQTDF